MDKKVSIAVIKRLPRYYRYLGDLLDCDILRISSQELSERMGITASQIRQDLNNFGCFGQQGYGYNVQSLYDEIRSILGLNKQYKLVIIGAGNIGQALVNYHNFSKRGFHFVAMFDINKQLIGKTFGDVSVYPIEELQHYLQNNPVDIAVLALQKSGAESVAQTLFSCGVKGIWNFSHTDLMAPPSVMVENVHLTDSLMTLSYRLQEDEIYCRFENAMSTE